MEVLGVLFVVFFWGTPIFIVVWGFDSKKILGRDSFTSATVAIAIWLAKAVVILLIGLSCLGGHCGINPFLEALSLLVSIGIDISIIGALWSTYADRKKRT